MKEEKEKERGRNFLAIYTRWFTMRSYMPGNILELAKISL